MIEEWKDIKGFEGLYQVSNLGRVLSLPKTFKGGGNGGVKSHNGIILKQTKATLYPSVNFSVNGVKTVVNVHRLVAEAFLPNPENKTTVNHIDGNKYNSNVSNLEWATQSENIIHAYKTGLSAKGARHSRSKIVLDTQTGIFYDCAQDAAKAKGYLYSTLHNWLNGHRPNKTSLIYA